MMENGGHRAIAVIIIINANIICHYNLLSKGHSQLLFLTYSSLTDSPSLWVCHSLKPTHLTGAWELLLLVDNLVCLTVSLPSWVCFVALTVWHHSYGCLVTTLSVVSSMTAHTESPPDLSASLPTSPALELYTYIWSFKLCAKCPCIWLHSYLLVGECYLSPLNLYIHRASIVIKYINKAERTEKIACDYAITQVLESRQYTISPDLKDWA